MGTRKESSFHGCYGHYCYLPLYIFCDERLLLAKLWLANVDGVIKEVERIMAQIAIDGLRFPPAPLRASSMLKRRFPKRDARSRQCVRLRARWSNLR